MPAFPRILIVSLSIGLFALGMLFSNEARAQSTDAATAPKILFFGDDFIALGAQRSFGFVHLIDLAYRQQGQTITVIPAGSGNNNSKDLSNRFDRDVTAKKPDWLVLECGVNDARPGGKNLPLAPFQANVTSMLDRAAAAGIKVVLLTTPMVGEDPAAPINQALAPYNDFLRGLAKQRNLALADVNAAMQDAIAQAGKDTHLATRFVTVDDATLNSLGDELVAGAILQGLGFTPAQVAQARDLWLDLPGGMNVTLHPPISVRQYLLLRALAAEQGRSVEDLINDELIQNLQKQLIKAPSALPEPKKKRHPKPPPPDTGT